ncbi:MAG: 5'-nucleotidase C-terminal domain-containing protein [Anaeromicrobium sp.]|uniref:5'-nucleotidase C-terminal domain-containing protein n=1 Tax=Anaeromicrobium sp. TaxID=1929132 RepID=UPI0025ECB50C|nr:5'-nucleotidase C-terminal domain-containing protein [Anaeromicrobium sp.]MCT4592841.1 5'-nucleotidase C-terminal domain-containing protein [Anaeromicrobium sp.]
MRLKRITAMTLLALMLTLAMFPVGTYAEETKEKTQTTVTEENVSTVQEGKTVVDIITINDFHGNVKEDARETGKNMGMSKVINAVKTYKEKNPNTIFVAAGDNYQGSAMSNLTYGSVVSEMFSALDTKVSAVGNHEFDWGVDKIENWSKDGGFKFLASNIYDTKTNEPVAWAKPYEIIEQDGIKIGFIGLTTVRTAYTTKAENIKGIEFRPIKESAEHWANYLKSEGKVDVVLALTHVGSFQDRETGAITGEVVDKGLTSIENLDGIISAHTHQSVAGHVNGKAIVQGYKYGRALGKMSLVFGEDKKLEKIDVAVDTLYKRKSELVADTNGDGIYNKYDKKLEPITSKVVGYTPTELAHERYSKEPSALGTLICEYLAKAAGTNIAITNGGGIRTSIDAGDVTLGELYEVLPFDNFLVKMDLKGSHIKALLEHGIGNEDIGMIQYSGIDVTYDVTKEVGQKISSMKVNGVEVQMDKLYSVATNDFIYNIDNPAKGGDGFNFDGAMNVEISKDDMREAVVKGFAATLDKKVDKKPMVELKPAAKSEVVYVVKVDDLLWKIGKAHGVDYKEIAKLNNLKNPNVILPGQKLLIPAM